MASLLVCGVNLVLAFVIVRVTLYESPKGGSNKIEQFCWSKNVSWIQGFLDEDQN